MVLAVRPMTRVGEVPPGSQESCVHVDDLVEQLQITVSYSDGFVAGDAVEREVLATLSRPSFAPELFPQGPGLLPNAGELMGSIISLATAPSCGGPAAFVESVDPGAMNVASRGVDEVLAGVAFFREALHCRDLVQRFLSDVSDLESVDLY